MKRLEPCIQASVVCCLCVDVMLNLNLTHKLQTFLNTSAAASCLYCVHTVTLCTSTCWGLQVGRCSIQRFGIVSYFFTFGCCGNVRFYYSKFIELKEWRLNRLIANGVLFYCPEIIFMTSWWTVHHPRNLVRNFSLHFILQFCSNSFFP